MKHLLFIGAAIYMLIACNQPTKATAETDSKDTTTTAPAAQNISYPYTAAYSTNFEIGDPKYAQTVLNLWKDYDNNSFGNDNGVFADTASMDFSGGQSVKGKDSVINAVKKFRGSITSATSSVTTFVVLKPKDKEETWVCIWGKEVDGLKNGKKDSMYLNEDWMFNKDGKVAYISQYAAK